MSVQAVAWVLEQSTARLGARLALLSIANHAHSDGTAAFPSYDTIAKEARLSRRQAVRAVATLVEEGHVSVEEKASPYGTNVYTITGLAPSDNLSPTSGGKGRWVVTNPPPPLVTSTTEVVTSTTGSTPEMSPEPSFEPSIEPSEGQNAAAVAAPMNGKGPRRFYLADVVNLDLIVSLKDRYRRRKAWDGVTPGLLTALVLGSEERGIPACGARAVNAAIDSLYANAADIPNPAGYLRDTAIAESRSLLEAN